MIELKNPLKKYVDEGKIANIHYRLERAGQATRKAGGKLQRGAVKVQAGREKLRGYLGEVDTTGFFDIGSGGGFQMAGGGGENLLTGGLGLGGGYSEPAHQKRKAKRKSVKGR